MGAKYQFLYYCICDLGKNRVSRRQKVPGFIGPDCSALSFENLGGILPGANAPREDLSDGPRIHLGIT